jgi:hypothetical protein
MKASWLNIIAVEACWAALAYYFGGNWAARLVVFLLLNLLVIWAWHKSRATP